MTGLARVVARSVQNVCAIHVAWRPRILFSIWTEIKKPNGHDSVTTCVSVNGKRGEATSILRRRTNFVHTSSYLLKTKGKKPKKMEVVVDPRDTEEFIDLNKVLADMKAVVEALKHDYMHSFRIGADTKRLEQVKVLLDGDEFTLREVATIRKKSEKTLELDFVAFPEALPAAEVAIQSSELNLNPLVKGTKMLVHIPVVTAEHRQNLVKAAKQRMNSAKDQVRKVRNHHEKGLAKIDNVPEDTEKAIRKQIGVYIDATLNESEEYFKMKEKDLLLK